MSLRRQRRWLFLGGLSCPAGPFCVALVGFGAFPNQNVTLTATTGPPGGGECVYAGTAWNGFIPFTIQLSTNNTGYLGGGIPTTDWVVTANGNYYTNSASTGTFTWWSGPNTNSQTVSAGACP